MKLEVIARDNRTDADTQALYELNQAVYPPDASRDGSERVEWSSSMWSVFVRDDQQKLVSHIGMVTRAAKCDDTPVFIGGVGGVQTHPDARGRGYAGHGMQKAAAYLRDELKVDFSLLVCRDRLMPYYVKFGWQRFDGDVLIIQSSGKIKLVFDNIMLLAGTKPIPQCGVIDLCGKPW